MAIIKHAIIFLPYKIIYVHLRCTHKSVWKILSIWNFTQKSFFGIYALCMIVGFWLLPTDARIIWWRKLANFPYSKGFFKTIWNRACANNIIIYIQIYIYQCYAIIARDWSIRNILIWYKYSYTMKHPSNWDLKIPCIVLK